MVFEDAYSKWTERRLMQEQAAELLGCGREDVSVLDGALKRGRDREASELAGFAGVAPGGVGGRLWDQARRVAREALPRLLPRQLQTRSYSWVKNKL